MRTYPPDFEDVLAKYSPDEELPHWAMLQDNLGSLYGQRPVGDRSKNLARAVEYSERAEKIFDKQGMVPERIKSLLNISRALIDQGPERIALDVAGSALLLQPLGAEVGVLDRAEQSLHQAEEIVDEANVPGAKAMLYQNLAEIELQRSELLHKDSLEAASKYLDKALAAAETRDVRRIAHVAYLRARVSAELFKSRRITLAHACESLDEAIAQNAKLGFSARVGEATFLRALISIREDQNANEWAATAKSLISALEQLAKGKAFLPARQCALALLTTLVKVHQHSVDTIVEDYRNACRLLLESAGTALQRRGTALVYLGAGLSSVGQHFSRPDLSTEALKILTEAEPFIIEREQPGDWAQLQLALEKLKRASSLPIDPQALENFERARMILKAVIEMESTAEQTKTELRQLIAQSQADIANASSGEATQVAESSRPPAGAAVGAPQFHLEFQLDDKGPRRDCVDTLNRMVPVVAGMDEAFPS